jgi:hypothetical protein
VRKKGEDKQPYIPLGLGFGIPPGVCGKSARTGFGLFPGSGDLPQSPANSPARQSAAFQQSKAEVKSRCLPRNLKNKPDCLPVFT